MCFSNTTLAARVQGVARYVLVNTERSLATPDCHLMRTLRPQKMTTSPKITHTLAGRAGIHTGVWRCLKNRTS